MVFKKKNSRYDFPIIANWVAPNSKVLDLGCSDGELLNYLKKERNTTGYGIEKDPDNWLKSLKAGINVLQVDIEAGLPEFEDNSFDIVASYIIHHEMPAEISRAIFAEAHRILRPGGFYFPIDFFTSGRRGVPGAFPKYQEWKEHRWNNEVWRMEYKAMDFAGDMEKVGFKVSHNGLPTPLDPYLEDSRKSISRNICGTKVI